MSDDLIQLKSALKYIKEYLVKLGPERRKSNLAFKKLEEAKSEYDKLSHILSKVCLQVETSEISTEDAVLINKLVDDINALYKKINSLVDDPIGTEVSSKMATEKPNFDLKTAIPLLPTMTGQESVTKQLIDSIELYSTMINNSSQQQLIDFVLKTRLSQSAKLRLQSKYDSVSLLVKDMKSKLLQKLSPVAIQAQLQRSKQGHRSIEAFGSELENLFVNLTIAQADGNDSAFEILRPLNEKIAIKRFSDGLSDPRLSTIVASRQFSSLPEAIRTAKDEKSMSTSTEPEVMKVRHSNFGSQARHGGNHRARYFRSNYQNNKNTKNYNSNSHRNVQNNRNFTRSDFVTNNNYRRNNYCNYNQRGNTGQRRIYANPTEMRSPGAPRHPRIQRTQHLADVNTSVDYSDNSEFFRS